MISLTNLKTLLLLSPIMPTKDEFIKIHSSVEGYMRRLLFIALRLNNVNSKTAQEVVKLSYLNNSDLFSKTISLLTQNSKTISDFETQNSNLKELLDLFTNFSSILRHRLLHGIVENIYDQRALKYAYYIDKYLIIEIEDTLIQIGLNSAFDTPIQWGAIGRGSTEIIDDVIKRLKLGKLTKPPLGMLAVKNSISKTKYSNLI